MRKKSEEPGRDQNEPKLLHDINRFCSADPGTAKIAYF